MRSSGRDVEMTSIKERGENDTGKTTMSETITQWLKEIISLKEKQDTQRLQEIINYRMNNNIIDNSKKPWNTSLMQEAIRKVTIQYMQKDGQWIPYIQGYHEVAKGCYCEQCTQARGQN